MSEFDDFNNEGKLFRLFIYGFFAFLLILMPIGAVMNGIAKAKYLKATKGIEFAWYEAAFLDVEMTSSEIGADISIKDQHE